MLDLNDSPVTLTPDGDTVLMTFADVPEAITFGADEDEALLQAVDVLECAKLGVYRTMIDSPMNPLDN